MLRSLVRWSDSRPGLRRARRALSRAPLVSHAIGALDERRAQRLEHDGDPRERSKQRWSEVAPGPGLTWGEELSGEAAVDVCERHGAFGEGRTILEIGPGYGRIMRAVLDRGAAFERYLGLELSEQNASHLRQEFADPRIEIVRGDAESTQLDEKVDTVFSFLTFKHLYPSFEGALTNLRPQLRDGGVVIFDLIEGSRSYFQRDEQTFVHEYTRAEAEGIVGRSGLTLKAFDRVEHAPERARLVVVARA